MDLTGHDRLQAHGNAGGNEDRIDGGLGTRPVATFSVDGDAQRVGGRVHVARRDPHLPGGEPVAGMQRNAHVRLREFVEEAIFYHSLGAGDGLFRGLAYHHQRSVPGVFALGHDGGGSVERCHVHIVPAGVHHANLAPAVVFGFDFAGVRKPVSSVTGSVSSSVRSITVGPAPFFMMATTPVPPTFSVTSYPSLRSRSASAAAVRVSCDESSGCWCRSRYHACASGNTDSIWSFS